MTPYELRAARLAIAPTTTQAAFARTLGYADADAYRKYEAGSRPVPHLLAMLMQAMVSTGWRPDGWPSGVTAA